MLFSHTGQRASVPPRDEQAPYLSVVVAARNDDHGGNLLARMQVFVDAWINQAKRHGLDSELIIVEWNPPAGRDRLASALRWPADAAPCQVRIIEVPPELHARYAPALPLYQMIAKNVGVRRALGEFILATNIDILFSDELVEFLASRRLEKGRMYRMDRHDVMSDVPVNGTLDQQLAYCQTHLIRLFAREGVFPLTADGLRQNEPEDITPADSGICFGNGWFPVETYAPGEVFRWIDDHAEILAQVPEGGAIMILEVEPGPGLGPLPQPLQVFDENGSKVAEWLVTGRTTMALAVPPAGKNSLRSFRLHVPGGGSPIVEETRILNFRVFRCEWAPRNLRGRPQPSRLSVIRQRLPTLRRLLGASLRFHGWGELLHRGPGIFWGAVRLLRRRGADIFEGGLDFQVGPGWSYLEESGGERFRWVSQDAQLAIRTPSANSRLALLLEPGPGLDYRPFVLLIRRLNGANDSIARARVNGLSYAEVSIPAKPGTITTLCFTSDAEGCPTGPDPRLLNFRVFACGAGASHAPSAPAIDAPARQGWPTLTLDSRPPVIHWGSRLEPWQRQINAMGQPRFLHTYACGDFTLIARQHWFDLRGYAELNQYYSMHQDSLLCYAAHHSGASEELLWDPMRAYHIEHGAGSGWTPEGQHQLNARLAQRGAQIVACEDLVWLITRMRSLRAPLIFNRQDWGLSRETLAETTPCASVCASGVGK